MYYLGFLLSARATSKRASQESPRSLKHLAIHILVEMGFLVFSNVAAKDTVDLIVRIPRMGELRTAGIRIKTSSYSEEYEKWSFKQTKSQHFIEKSPFVYIFCLKTDDPFRPIFIVLSSTDLATLMPAIRRSRGNYNFSISRNQVEGKNLQGRDWVDCVGWRNLEKIKNELERE